MVLGIGPDQQGQAGFREKVHQSAAPQLRALPSRRGVAAARTARIAKAHWHDRDSRFVVELLIGHAHPVTQPIP